MKISLGKTAACLLACCCLLSCLAAASAENYTFDRQDENWHTSWNLEAPKPFGGEIAVYKYKQRRKNESRVRKQMSEAFGNPVLSAKPNHDQHLCPGNHTQDGLPDFVSSPAVPSAPEQAAIDRFRQILNGNGFPCGQPYLCAAAETLFRERSQEMMGHPADWDFYTGAFRCESYDYEILPGDLLVEFAPEINGDPVLPELIGNTGEFALPMFALALVRGGTVSYMEYGGSFEIVKEEPVTTDPVDWKTAVDLALDYSYEKFWKGCFRFEGVYPDVGLDYPRFAETYRPFFDLKAERVAACYYAENGKLRPAWQVCMILEVFLENSEGLSPEARHRYVPDVMRRKYIVDAVTGEVF